MVDAARFLDDVRRNPPNAGILSRWSQVALPHAWLVAGCLFQTVWNLRSGRAAHADMADYDLFYFDANDLSAAAEIDAQARMERIFNDVGARIEVTNQVRVHPWYGAHFGRPCAPWRDVFDGIGRFLVTETCVGVRPHACHAPFGVHGVDDGTLTPNPATPYPELFAAKVASYRARGPWLQVRAAPPQAVRA